MNSSEVLFCALLLTKDAESAPDGRSSLEHWSSAVLSEEKHALELEAAWKPRTDKRTAIDYFGPLERVFKRSWPYAELDTVGLAMQAWRRDGQYDGLTGELLHNYLARTPFAARTCKKTAPPKRWRSWAVIKIGRLLYDSAPALRKLLKLDVASEEVKPLHVVAAERAERISSLEAELKEQHAAAQHVQDAWRKAAGRLKKTHGAVTQARREERAKLSAKLSEERKALKPRAREEAEAKVADNIERVNRLRNEADARAREAEKKVRACERKIGRLEKTIEKMEEEDSDEAPESPEPDEPDEPASKISRRDERGRFTGIPWEVRPLIYGQHARRTPPSAINANITQVLKVFAEEKVIPLPALDELRRMRGELTVAGEAMAAMRVALAYVVRPVDEDAAEIEMKALFSTEELAAKAEAAMQRRVEAGISDSVEDLNAGVNNGAPPAFDQALVGKRIEVLWPYTDKNTGKRVLIWATGRVARVADGLTHKSSARARTVLPAGMVLWTWEADPEYEEPAGEKWLALQPKKWNKQQLYSWRYDPREFSPAAAPTRDERRRNTRMDCEA